MDCLRQWLTENSYSRQEELSFGDCDASGRARMGTLLGLLAAAAGHDFDARGLPWERLYAMRQVILLSRIALRVRRSPVTGEVVTVTTYENGSRGAHMRRNFEIAAGDGTLLLSAKSDWILVDPVERKILRPSAFTGRVLTLCTKEIDAPECGKLTLPAEGTEELGRRPVRYSDLDCNGHVYSGNYGDIVWDALPPELQTAPVREFALNYSKEAVPGEELTLRGLRQGDEYRMEGLCGAGVCFTARCLFGEPD